MAVPDWQVVTPTAQQADAAILAEGDRTVQGAFDRNQAGNTIDRMNTINSERTLPQLQSSIGATGQYYSGARQKAEIQNAQDLAWQKGDVTTSLQRQLYDLDRQRSYASIGLIV